MNEKRQKPIGIALFFFSGLVSLVFQVLWLKMLLLVFGNTVWAVTTLLTAFMAGLALGSWIFGKIADRTSSPLRLYGILEGLIGFYALLTPFIFGKLHILYVPLYSITGGETVIMGIFKFAIALIFLLPPTICMGASLPLLAKRFTGKIKEAGSNIGLLYTVNTFGAVLGTFATGFILIPFIGLKTTIIVASLINFAILAVVILLTRKEKLIIKEAVKSKKKTKPTILKWILWIYLGCGFAGLAYEVIWSRIFVLHIGSSVYAYSIMLAIYLLGIALGSAIMSHYVDRLEKPGLAFAIIQFLIAFDLIFIVKQFGHLSTTITNLGELVGASEYLPFILSIAISTAQVIILPTVLFGASFPLAVKLFVKKQKEVGTETGLLYAFNTAGTIFGAFVAGFILLPTLGAQISLLIIAIINLFLGGFLMWKSTDTGTLKKTITVGVLTAMFFGGYFTLTGSNEVILQAGVFKGGERENVKILAFEEDVYATVTVEERMDVRGTWRSLSMNGVNVAGTSSELFSIQKMQGHLPMLLHPNPKSVLHIGFGSGGTAWAVTQYPVEKITIAEISRSIIKKASKYFKQVNHNVLQDPRIEIVFTDGRNKVLASKEKYDVILSDSIHPRFSGNGSLYTYDYYKLLKERLKPSGVVSQWLPFYSITPENFKMILKSFHAVFPNTSVWYINSTFNSYVIVIGKLDNPKIDYANIERQLQIPGVAADLREISTDSSYKILDFFLFANEKVDEFTGDVPLHTDDNMAVEYLSGRAVSKFLTSFLNYVSLLKHRTSVQTYLCNLENASEAKGDILDTIYQYETATSFNLRGQLLFQQEKRLQAYRQFNMIPIYNPDDLEPVEYFGASYQKPFLRKAALKHD